MADQISTIKITAEDDTSKGLNSAIRNFENAEKKIKSSVTNYDDLPSAERAVAKRLKLRNIDYNDQMAKAEKNRKANIEAAKAVEKGGKAGSDALGGIAAAASKGAAGLALMAAKAIATGTAMEVVRRGFVGFAEWDTQLRMAQNATGMTGAGIDHLSKSMKNLAAQTGETADSLMVGFNQIREAANLTGEQAEALLPKMSLYAKGVGADLGSFGRAAGDLMRNFNIPAEEATAVFEIMSHAATKFNLNIDEIGPRLSSLSEMMAYWGYTGKEGAAQLATFAGVVKEVTGSAPKAAATLTNLFSSLSSGQMSEALGFTSAKKLEEDLRAAEDPLGRLIFLMSSAKDQYAVMQAIGISNVATFHRLRAELTSMADKIRETERDTGGLERGLNMSSGPGAAIDRLSASFTRLSESIGGAADAVGGTLALDASAAVVDKIAVALENIVDMTNFLSGHKGDGPPDWWPESWAEFFYRVPGGGDRDFWTGELKTPYEKSPEGIREKYLEGLKKAGKNPDGTPYVKTPAELAEEEILRSRQPGPDAQKRGRLGTEPGRDRFGYTKEEEDAEQLRRDRQSIERKRRELLYGPDAGDDVNARPMSYKRAADAADDAAVKMIKFANALPDTNEALVWKAAMGIPGYGGNRAQAAFETIQANGPAPGQSAATYGGSTDVKYLQAAYHPSGAFGDGGGGGYSGGGGGGGGAGPGGSGTGYGGSGPPPRGGSGDQSRHITGGKNLKLAAPQGEGLQQAVNVSPEQYDTFRRTMAHIESGGQYGIMGGSSGRFAGAYQMGAQEIAETAKSLGLPTPSREEFLNNPDMQEKFFAKYTQNHHEYLLKNSPEYRAMTPEQQMEVLGYAHNQGAGGAAQWLRTGQAGSDQFGTSGTKYSDAIHQALGGGGGGGGPVAGAGGVAHTGSGKALPPEVLQSMEYAGVMAGVRTEIAHGNEPGHARHKPGSDAGDIDLYDPVDGHKLDSTNPADRAKMAAYIEASAASGNTGIGMGGEGEYMGKSRMHVGVGGAAVWGAGGKGANTPQWVREAYDRGMAKRVSPEQQRAAIDEAKQAAEMEARAAEHNKKLAEERKATPDVAESPEVKRATEPIQVELHVKDTAMQFARSTMARNINSEVREARSNTYSDIGVA